VKTTAKIELFESGIVVFDPVALNDFVISNAIQSHDLFDFFLNNEKVGRSAVESGVIVPIYQVPQTEYSFFLKGVGNDSSFKGAKEVLCCSDIPLKVVSDLVVVADLNALMDWDEVFFMNYRAVCADGLGNNDYLDVVSGFYALSIKGFKGLNYPFVSLGYELAFNPVGSLPSLSIAATSEDWGFSIV